MESFFTAVADQWVRNMTTDCRRYAVFAIGVWLVLWVLLAGVLKSRKIRAESPPARQLVIEFLISVRSVMIFSTIGLLPFVLERAGLAARPRDRRDLGTAMVLGEPRSDDRGARRLFLLGAPLDARSATVPPLPPPPPSEPQPFAVHRLQLRPRRSGRDGVRSCRSGC